MGWAAVDSPRQSARGSLLGREDDLVAVAVALEASRLVTLTGAPGIGKTSLALAVAADHQEPAVVVELAAVGEPSLIPAAVASALAVQEAPGHGLMEAIAAHLRSRRLLLVLDNCEHLLEACAETASGLLDACPDLRVLATSREPLGLVGELVSSVPPLTVPNPEGYAGPDAALSFPAIALFVERAAQVQPGFALTSPLATDVVAICRRLDGIPLAIELAATRVGSMTPHEIARRLESHLGLLSDPGQGPAPRHRTLASALEWSYTLLSDPEREALCCLSVFAGTFELEAAAAVCAFDAGAASELLDRLVSKSLLVADPDHIGRYRLLVTVRAYAAEQLERTSILAEVRTRHAVFYTALAERAEPEFTGPRQLDWFDRIAAERANLRAAVEWSLARGDQERALRLTSALVLFWRVRGPYSEGRELLRAALSAGEGEAPQLSAKALWGAGFLSMMAGEFPAAMPLLERSIELYRKLGDRSGCARALLILADCAEQFSGRSVSEVSQLLMESVGLAREAQDHWCLAHALGVIGFRHAQCDELDDARAMLEEALTVARGGGDLQGLRYALIGLGDCAILQGAYQEAESLLQEAVVVTDALGEDYDRSVALTALGSLALCRGRHAHAREFALRALTLIPEMAPLGVALEALALLARAAHAQGDRAFARELLVRLSSWTQGAAYRLDLARVTIDDGDLERGRDLLEEALARARAGRAKRTTAETLNELGLLARFDGDWKHAASLHTEALMLEHEVGELPSMASTLEAAAGLAVISGAHERAGRLFGAALARREASDYARSPREEARYDADLATLRQSLDAEPVAEALRAGHALSMDQAVGEALDALRPARTIDARHSLTEREVEIAELVADGLSNIEIAERLVIAPETVKTHLSHISAKLGVSGRAMIVTAFRSRWKERLPVQIDVINAASGPQTEADAYRFLEALRWPDGEPACPHCGTSRRPYFLKPDNRHSRRSRDGSLPQRRVWKCAECRKQFSVLTGTIFHGSKLPVRIWLVVIHEIVNAGEHGLSAREIERAHRLRPATASFMVERLRDALEREPLASLVSKRVAPDDSTSSATTTSGDGASPQGNPTIPVSAERVARLRTEIQSTIARVRRDAHSPYPPTPELGLQTVRTWLDRGISFHDRSG